MQCALSSSPEVAGPGEPLSGSRTQKSKNRVILIGIGGTTCSGKSTLVNALQQIIPNSTVIRQDDFWPPLELMPMHPTMHVQDCETPETAIDWPRFVQFLRDFKATGIIPGADNSDLGSSPEQAVCMLGKEVQAKWKVIFEHASEEMETKGEHIVWGLVDGYLLYWNPEVASQLDVKILIRVPHDILKKRREEWMYTLADGSAWQDPPFYWDKLVYPAYVDAHAGLFENGDVENGALRAATPTEPSLVLVEGLYAEDSVDTCCRTVLQYSKLGRLT